jgi:hypothetical protein
MSFCQLPPSQVAALMLIVGAPASDKTPAALKKLIADKDWHTLAVILSLGSPGTTVPSEADLTAVGNMSPGMQNANLVLAMADASTDPNVRSNLQKALDTHCWDFVANKIVSSMTNGLTFSGDDLHRAYAPTDSSPCNMPTPNAIEVAIAEVIGAGGAVGAFFSQTLPNFFENDFSNFFTGTIGGFFAGDFANFFVDLGNNIKDGFVDFGNAVQNAFEAIGQKLDPTKW